MSDAFYMTIAARVCGVAVLASLIAIASSIAAWAEMSGVVPRSAWNAKQPKTGLMQRQMPREIIVHMTGVRMQPKISLERKMRGLQSYSQRAAKIGKRRRRAWGDVPYHYYIGASGRIAKGRAIVFAGDTNTKYRVANRIQVVVEGQFDRERPRARQLQSLTRLTRWLAAKYKIPASRISGHNDHVATSCPGKHLKAYLPKLRTAVGG